MKEPLTWFKSSYSDSQGGACLEVAACPHTIHVRDSKLGARSPASKSPERLGRLRRVRLPRGLSPGLRESRSEPFLQGMGGKTQPTLPPSPSLNCRAYQRA